MSDDTTRVTAPDTLELDFGLGRARDSHPVAVELEGGGRQVHCEDLEIGSDQAHEVAREVAGCDARPQASSLPAARGHSRE